MLRHALLRAGSACLSALVVLALLAQPTAAATTKVSIRASVQQVLVGRTFTLSGSLSPTRKGVTITRQVHRDGRWKATGSTVTNGKGDWRMVVTAPVLPEHLRLRVQVSLKAGTVTSSVVTVDAVRKLAPTPSPRPTPSPTPSPTVTPTPTPTPSVTPSPTVTASDTPTAAVTDSSTVVDTATAIPTPSTAAIAAYGPGKRILGVDISRYQHPTSALFPNGAPIDFRTMYKGGVRFIFIKASDGRDNGHNNATPWYANDRRDAQAAGILTGFYHYAYFPQSTLRADIVADAQAQADKAVWRLASVGGYNAMDLPYALDVEEWCFGTNDNGSCLSRVTRANATLWTKTWLARVYERTGRRPFVYSSAWFLENILDRDAKLGELRSYPLWIAHAGLKPADPTNYPGMKTPYGCYITAWTLSDCRPRWAVWQYMVASNEDKYGIAGGNIDMNLFNGTAADLRAFTQGTWVPTPGDFLPVNETTTTTVSGLVFSLTTAPVTFTADVRRITGGPVVSGTVTLQLLSDINGVPPTADQISAMRQTVKRTASGTWQVSVAGLPAGTWNARVVFRDTSGVHAQSFVPVLFTLIDPNPQPDTSTATTDTTTVTTPTDTATPGSTLGPTPGSTPGPTPSPTPTPSPSPA